MSTGRAAFGLATGGEDPRCEHRRRPDRLGVAGALETMQEEVADRGSVNEAAVVFAGSIRIGYTY